MVEASHQEVLEEADKAAKKLMTLILSI